MTLELFYSIRCPKSQEILTQILGSNIRHNFTLISIDKHLQTKRRMPKGIRITPTVHRETPTQIHVYEGDDILTLIAQLKQTAGPSPSNPSGVSGDLINLVGPSGPPAIRPAGSAANKNHPKPQGDESWKTSTEGNLRFEIPDTVPAAKIDAKAIEAQRAESDRIIKAQIEASKNDPKIQDWINGIKI